MRPSTRRGKPADSFPLLRSQEKFEAADARSKNWRALYLYDFGMSEAETEEAGRLFTEYQFQDPTPTPFFAGIDEVLCPAGHRFFRIWNDGAVQGCSAVPALSMFGNLKERKILVQDRPFRCTTPRYCDCDVIERLGKMSY